VTNGTELTRKYGKAGLKAIRAELKKLAAADKTVRSLATAIIFLDVAADMKPYGGNTVTSAGDCRQNKVAIDAVFAKETPDYLVILGAPDVVPYQDMLNPVHDPGGDDDPLALGDLPYACDKPYSRDVNKFIGPTRVVGRLPDLCSAGSGNGNLAYITGVIRAAAASKPKPQPDPLDYFGLSAAVWTVSTQLSLQGVYGDDTRLLNCPKAGPTYTSKQLGKLSHFINCHGAQVSPTFYGQDPNNLDSYPDAMRSTGLAGLTPGTAAAFECCYGAELYDPQAAQGVMSIANRYLEKKACGVCASTTIAYGPPDSNAQADLMCRYFMLKVLSGASTGMAMLEARQEFIRTVGTLSPVDLKTLGQYVLLGDPSLQAFRAAKDPQEAIVTTKKVTMLKRDDAGDAARLARRQKLATLGAAIGAVTSFASEKAGPAAPSIRRFLAQQLNIPEARANVEAFHVHHPKSSILTKTTSKLMDTRADKHYVLIHSKRRVEKEDGIGFDDLVGLVASEIDGRMIIRKFVRR